jgi:hypothetical protein
MLKQHFASWREHEHAKFCSYNASLVSCIICLTKEFALDLWSAGCDRTSKQVLPQSCAFATQLSDSTVRCRTLNRALLVASAKLFEHTRGTAGHCSWAVENGFLYILLNRVEKGENSTQNNGSPILEAQLKQSVNCSDWESAPDTSSAWCTFSIKSNARFAGIT